MKDSSLTEASATPATIGTRARAAYETVDSQWNAQYTIADRHEGESGLWCVSRAAIRMLSIL